MVELRELVGEGEREQEAEEHLHADAGDAQLLQQLEQVAVDALRFRLVPSVLGSGAVDTLHPVVQHCISGRWHLGPVPADGRCGNADRELGPGTA